MKSTIHICVRLLFVVGLALFLNGFLLTRRVLLEHSTGTMPASKANEFERVVLVVIDALRYDFIEPNNRTNSNNNSYYLNQMPFVRQLLETNTRQCLLQRLIADPPTTTLQRLKALTTGTLPTFIDLSYNFIGYEIEEDNILHQLDTNVFRRHVSLLGDDTWLALYPNVPFQQLHVYPSFDVHDLDTVDNGILQHLWTIMSNMSVRHSSFIIAHFLGRSVRSLFVSSHVFLLVVVFRC
jgi:GPI ethanolamine phosphate transferase 3 subunit O